MGTFQSQTRSAEDFGFCFSGTVTGYGSSVSVLAQFWFCLLFTASDFNSELLMLNGIWTSPAPLLVSPFHLSLITLMVASALSPTFDHHSLFGDSLCGSFHLLVFVDLWPLWPSCSVERMTFRVSNSSPLFPFLFKEEINSSCFLFFFFEHDWGMNRTVSENNSNQNVHGENQWF